jgi:hypothetical protein
MITEVDVGIRVLNHRNWQGLTQGLEKADRGIGMANKGIGSGKAV